MNIQILKIIIIGLVLIVAGVGGAWLSNKINRLNEILKRAAQGDLTKKASLEGLGIFKELALNINGVILRIRGFINDTTIMTDKLIGHYERLKKNGEQVQELTEGTCKRIEGISRYTQEQATYVEKTKVLIGEMIKEHTDIAENGERIESLSKSMDEKIEETNKVYEGLIAKLNQSAQSNESLAIKSNQLFDKAYKIQNIVDTVNQISDNTKLLALNASIEAARAGENGAGFSVIAQEIQKLADMSSIQSKEIQNIIGDIKQGISDIADNMNKEVGIINNNISFSNTAKDYLIKTASANKETLKAVENINHIIQNQSSKISNIKDIVAHVNSIAQDINQDTETMNVAAQEQLATVINVFDSVSHLIDLNKGIKSNIDSFIKNYMVNEQTKEYIEKGLKNLIDLSKNEILSTMEWAPCTKLLKQKIAENPYFELFGLIDKDGLRKAITLEYNEQEVLVNFGHRHYFKEAVKGKNFRSQPYISMDTNNYCIAIAVPVKDHAGEIAGILMGDLILG